LARPVEEMNKTHCVRNELPLKSYVEHSLHGNVLSKDNGSCLNCMYNSSGS